MLSHYFRTRRLRAAVHRCQLLLAPQLRRDYGTTNGYTIGQITHAMQRAKMPRNDLELACAAFMTEAAFNAANPFPQEGLRDPSWHS